ncbi:3-phenylpropionate/trans-cinnamate dioxygenase ferredoxin subunit [Paenibacillus sp. 1_12]|uniref:Rieske (2Fe-2S) protein n=1 Tax=Paenibacillus sp. 1_12 TaxID=1566278 RepID=UPI0008EEC38C|nr:Rieske (2Fe-2S) protein [Paenibacillus sp. 1_12]SFL56327.1 3-phenylpropionate/trans-cinnamate dioxygenase ferredoxin subunit [Paenibacillus sp. 1_12]
MGRHVVGNVSEIIPGGRKLVVLEGISLGVFNVNKTYFAIKNSCPHQQAPLCVGTIAGTTLPSKPGEYIFGREGEIIRCPWHGWEFDITTGQSVYDPNGCWVKSYPVSVEQGETELEKIDQEEPPHLETYPVAVEDEKVVVYIADRTRATAAVAAK